MNMLHLVIFAQKVLTRITVTSDKERNNNKTINQAACWKNFGKMFRISLLILYISTLIYADSFKEELLVQPLANNDLLASFNFVTVSLFSQSRQHFDLMPRLVGELIDEHKLEEIDLSLSRGVWRAQHWGLSPRTTATGAKVSAFFSDEVLDLDKSWKKLTNALAGQFCASLNFLDSTQSINPKWSFNPSGILTQSSKNNVKFGMLPGENVCTENLTPWKKLLPCGTKRGLATMLNADHIHTSKYHSLGLSLRKICPNHQKQCSDPELELSLYVVLVFDPAGLPDNLRASAAEKESNWSHWSIRTLFGIGITSACAVADSSKIFIDVTQDTFELLPENQESQEIVLKTEERTLKEFDVQKLVNAGINNLSAKYKKPTIYGLIPKPRIHATRYFKGHGNEKGGIVTRIFNEGQKPLNVVFLDIIPWYLRVYFHTLKIRNGQKEIKPHFLDTIPGRDRERAYSLEMVFEIPAKSSVEISIEFEKSILKWLEYPPDANKGFYVNSALITTLLPEKSNFTGITRMASTYEETFSQDFQSQVVVQLYTESLLVNLPTPDFSMPYNVICLTCTVVALAFGPLHNITTKTLTLVETKDAPTGVLDKVKSFFSKSFGKKNTTTEKNEEESTKTEEDTNAIHYTQEEMQIFYKLEESKKDQ